MERFALRVITVQKDLLELCLALEELTQSKWDLRRLKNAVSALLILIITNKALLVASLVESLLSLKKALPSVVALVLSVLTLVRMHLVAAVVVTSSRMRMVKNSAM